MISYRNTLEGISPNQLEGFFVGWLSPPSPETHLRLLAGSDYISLAVDDETGAVVGFVTAITDGVLSAYLSFLEVLPSHRHQGIGHELIRRILDALRELYMVDLLCDPELQPLYGSLGMLPATGMFIRRYEAQSGTRPGPTE